MKKEDNAGDGYHRRQAVTDAEGKAFHICEMLFSYNGVKFVFFRF